MNNSFYTRKHTVLVLIVAVCASLGAYLYLNHPLIVTAQSVVISPFQDDRDTKDILQLFDDNWHWLISSPDYSPSYALKYRAPNRNPRYLGALQIYVLHENAKFAGFVAPYFKRAHEGFILFLGVKEEFRRKNYGRKLVRYAIDTLIDQGATSIKLVTRTTNTKAQALYKSLNFEVESVEPDGFVYFKYIPTGSRNISSPVASSHNDESMVE